MIPDFRRNELINAIERLSGDLCVSRPKERLSWGIEFPFDPDYVTYVWFDALLNYVSFAGYLSDDDPSLPNFSELWPCKAHIIGKDILVPAHGSLLANHASCHGLFRRADAEVARPWMVEHSGGEDEQKSRKHN